jgi:hypothetical protein
LAVTALLSTFRSLSAQIRRAFAIVATTVSSDTSANPLNFRTKGSLMQAASSADAILAYNCSDVIHVTGVRIHDVAVGIHGTG